LDEKYMTLSSNTSPYSDSNDLSNIDLTGWGLFSADEKAGFVITNQDLPAPWEYLYQNGKMLLKVDQYGPVYAQANPPGDILFFRREGFQKYASWVVWLRSEKFAEKAFTNFRQPALGPPDVGGPSGQAEITYTPDKVVYQIEHEAIRCETEFFVPPNECAIAMKLTLTNLRRRPLSLSAIPALRPYLNPAQLAPWDRPEWYVRTAFVREQYPGFLLQLLNMNSQTDKRRYAALWSSVPDDEWHGHPGHDSHGLEARATPISAEVDYDRFIGAGTFEIPQAVLDDRLRLTANDAQPWGRFETSNTMYALPSINALRYEITLQPGESRTIRQVLAMVPNGPDGTIPDAGQAMRFTAWLDDERCKKDQQILKQDFDHLCGLRRIETPDAALNRYANEWLPLQLDWVCSLDRGWPTGMRGSRDSAQDFTALAPLDATRCRSILERMMGCQRSDGWFPRQYSVLGRKGQHDLRGHVDAGNCVIELLYEYLCWSRDWDILNVRLPWLDDDAPVTVLTHALRAMEYFLNEHNLGEHGLCKIGEGDWLDAVNRAGLEGRGESVTVTCQTIISLTWMTQLLEKLKTLGGKIPSDHADTLLSDYAARRRQLKSNLLRHALNAKGFFNSVFNDDGQWIFSDLDPDGQCRFYGPANWFAIISGVAASQNRKTIFSFLDQIKCPDGYRLFYPPMGSIPIPKVGRSGSGDLPAGAWENGTVYNHGSHGFLARALAAAGDGDRLYDVLQYMLPYDQSRHPVRRAMTPPYGVTNCYLDIPGNSGRGGLVFLTGTIAYALRTVYNWLLGVKPTLDGLTIDPCIPAHFTDVRADFTWLNTPVHLHIANPHRRQSQVQSMRINGQPITAAITDPFTARKLFLASDSLFHSSPVTLDVTI
jgi:hypothetical protein